MPVLISSATSNPLPFPIEDIRRIGETLLELCGHQKSELSILLSDDSTICRLNDQYRHKAKPTNVLSFPLTVDEEIVNGTMLGDIVISIDTAAREAKLRGVGCRDRVLRLLIHGLVHLLGFDHEISDEDAQKMLQKENDLMKKLVRQEENILCPNSQSM